MKKKEPPPFPRDWKLAIPHLFFYRSKEILLFIIIILAVGMACLWKFPDEVVAIIKELKK